MPYKVIGAGAVGDRGHLTVQVDGYPGWVLEVVVMPTPTGLAVTDLSVIPYQLTYQGPDEGSLKMGSRIIRKGERWPESSWSELGEDVPPGGIPTRLMRAINMGQLVALARKHLAADGAFKAGAAKRLGERNSDLADQFRTMAQESVSLSAVDPVKRSGRRGNGIDHYLRWAMLYDEKIRAGVTHPNKELAEEHHETPTYVRDTITDARRRYKFLTDAGQGRAGGLLTEKALALIAERRNSKDEVQHEQH